jgi:hypothetical protein
VEEKSGCELYQDFGQSTPSEDVNLGSFLESHFNDKIIEDFEADRWGNDPEVHNDNIEKTSQSFEKKEDI